MKLSKEAKVGLLVVISCTILYTGFNFLKGKDYFSTSNTYFIKYSDIDGLTKSNSITLNGFAIGRVDNITLMHGEGGDEFPNAIRSVLFVSRVIRA